MSYSRFRYVYIYIYIYIYIYRCPHLAQAGVAVAQDVDGYLPKRRCQCTGVMASNSGASTSSSTRSTRKRPAKTVTSHNAKTSKQDSPPPLTTSEQTPDLPEITPSSSAEVHGVLLNLSPMKKSKNDRLYFEGRLGNPNQRQLRIVGFSCSQHSALSSLQREKEPLAHLLCMVKLHAACEANLMRYAYA